jgi:hypothetical protein
MRPMSNTCAARPSESPVGQIDVHLKNPDRLTPVRSESLDILFPPSPFITRGGSR